jgi:hypothetical protein
LSPVVLVPENPTRDKIRIGRNAADATALYNQNHGFASAA